MKLCAAATNLLGKVWCASASLKAATLWLEHAAIAVRGNECRGRDQQFEPLLVWDLHTKQTRRVAAQNFRTLFIGKPTHLPLNGFRGMRPGALRVWIVTRPTKIIDQIELVSDSDT